MKVIIKDSNYTYIISKSKFIGIIHKVYSKNEIDNIIEEYRKKHSQATHICYAYILPNIKKYSDDGEPLGTAGIPILDVLEKNNLCYVLAVVIRYFGGIKLGSNGLIRSYSHTISETLINNIKDLEYGYLIKIIENYDKINTIEYILKDSQIISKQFLDKIIIYAIINKKILENFSNIHYEILEEKII